VQLQNNITATDSELKKKKKKKKLKTVTYNKTQLTYSMGRILTFPLYHCVLNSTELMRNVLKHKTAARNVSTISLMALKEMTWEKMCEIM
jgi:hypothetical protein